MTLWLEWSTVTFMYQAALMEYHHIDPTYYAMHQAIDNAATGHGRMGVNAVKYYLRRVLANDGEEAMQAGWERIWNSYLCFKYQDFILQSEITKQLAIGKNTSLSDQMVDMIQRKAPYAQYNHQDVKLDGKLLNDRFAESVKSRESAKELLQCIQKQPYLVNPNSPLESGIFKLMKFKSKMYGVFEKDEQLLWLRWITSLAPQSNPQNHLAHRKLPRAALAAAKEMNDDSSMKTALQYLKPNVCPSHSFTPIDSSDGTVASVLNEGVDAIMNALSNSSSLREEFLNAVHSEGAMGSSWDQVIPGLGQKGSTIADNWCAAKNATGPRLSRLGFWLPNDDGLSKYVMQLRKNLPEHVEQKESVTGLRREIENDSVLKLLITRMVEEAKKIRPIDACSESVSELLKFLDHLITTSPSFNESGLVGCPINAILDTSMATRHGYSLFRYPPFNKHMKEILNEWGRFLQTDESKYTLGTEPGGWFSPEALKAWDQDDFVIPKSGFNSWNDFFTRNLRGGVRPIADGEDVVVSAADSTKFSLQKNVGLDSKFWIKSEPYALRYIFGPRLLEHAKKFEGGDVYQAFLNAYSYHRWHAPFGGKVVCMEKVEGLYYSESESSGIDFAGPDLSQGYIAHCAARGVILIEAPPPVGLYAVIPIGMAEISGIVWAKNLQVDCQVQKGQELGNFSFGGSTHCVIFRKGVIAEWFDYGEKMVKMGQPLARVISEGSHNGNGNSHCPFKK